MGLFDKFKKKKGPVAPPTGAIAPPAPGALPVREVAGLKASGLNNEQIINQLKSSGFTFSQIRDALSQVETKESVTGTPAAPLTQGLPNPFAARSVATVASPSAAAPLTRGASKKEDTVEEMERILEEIIREKWAEVQVELDRVNIWKNKMDSKISKVEEETSELKNRLDSIHVQTTEKVEEFGRSIIESKTEMQAMEKVMSKLIPSLSENIKELREVVGQTKGRKRKTAAKEE